MIEVRFAKPGEAEIIHKITQAAFLPTRDDLNPQAGALDETIEELQKIIQNNGAVIAYIGEQPAGACRMPIHDDHVHCGRLAVFPAMQGKGVGSAILKFLEEEARRRNLPEVRLATRAQLESNVAFYQRLGYVITGRTQHPRGTDMVVEFSKSVTTSQ